MNLSSVHTSSSSPLRSRCKTPALGDLSPPTISSPYNRIDIHASERSITGSRYPVQISLARGTTRKTFVFAALQPLEPGSCISEVQPSPREPHLCRPFLHLSFLKKPTMNCSILFYQFRYRFLFSARVPINACLITGFFLMTHLYLQGLSPHQSSPTHASFQYLTG